MSSFFFFFFLFSFFVHRAKRAKAAVDWRKTLSWVHTLFLLSLPACKQLLDPHPWVFSIIHQCLHYSLYLLAPGKCSLSWVAQGQYTTNTVDTGSVLSPKCCLWGDMHLCVVSAIVGMEIPRTHHRAKTQTSDQDTLGWKFCPSKRDVMLTALKESQHL